MDFRFVAYNPQTGTKLYQLPRANSVQIGDTFGTRGTIELKYSAKAANARDLPTFLEVQAEVTFDGGHNWAEIGPRLLRLSGEHEDTDAAGMRTLRFVGREWILEKARVGNGELELIDGKRPFYRASPGEIIRTLILEAQDRGAGQGIELGGFTSDRDAAGNLWSKVATIYYSPGLPIASVLENLVEQGMCDYRLDGRTLNLYDPETAMGRDLTTGANPVRVHGAVTEAPVKYSLEDLASAALLIGDEGFELEVENPSAPDDYGRLEVTIEQGGVSDAGTARIMVDEALQRGSREIKEITRSQSASGAAFLPYRDYRVGDFVQVLDSGSWERYRVREIQLVREGQEWAIHTVINDRLQELLLKLAKRTNGIVNGSKGSGGDGTRPTPPENPGIEPAAPAGLVIDQQVYLDRQGIARGQITAGWGEVTESTKGQHVEIGGYELWWRRNETGAVWTRAAVTTGDLSVSHSPVVLSDVYGNAMAYQWRVRAIASASTRPGPFSNIVTLTMTQDTTPPPPPSLPVVETDLRIITVDWDGLDEDGEAMPVDFNHVRIYFAAAEDMAGAERVGSLTQPGVWNSGSMEPDVPVWVAVSAVDNVGNESAITPAQSVTPRKLVDDESIRDELGTIDDKINDAVDELNQAIENIVIDANGTTTYWMPTEPDETTDPAPKRGDLWFDTSEDGKNELHRFDGQEWVSAADQRIDDINTAVDELNEAIDNIIIDANGTTTYQTPYEPDETTDPQPKAGDLWFDTSDNMKLHRFDGNEWVSASDGRIDTIKDAQDDLASDLDEVRVSANGKSRIIYSDRAPSAEDEGTANDVWWVGETLPTVRNIVMVGDSITEGVGASHTDNRWQTIVQERLSPTGAQYPFIPADSQAPTPGFPVTRGGAVQRTTNAYRWGFGWRTAVIYDHTTDETDPGYVEFTFTGTSAEVLFVAETSTGVAEISVDGGAPIVFDTNRAANGGNISYGLTWSTGPLAAGEHTVRVTRSETTSTSNRSVYVEGALTFSGDEVSGTRLVDSAKAGISTRWWTVDANRLTGLVGTTEVPGAFNTLESIDLVCLGLGTNDYRVEVPVAEYKQNYENFIGAARAAGYTGKFLLIGMYQAANRDSELWDEFHQAMQQIAGTDTSVEYLDLRPLVPGPDEAPANYADVSHPNDAGHLVMANAIEAYIRATYPGRWTVSAQYVHDGTDWQQTDIDGQVIANLDAGTIVSGFIDSARIQAGSLNADTVLVPGSAGSTVIRDGAITTEKIEAGAITAESGIIGSIDAGTISVGEMNGERIAAGTVTAEKLLVGSPRNLIANGDLEKRNSAGWPASGTYREQYGPGGSTPNVFWPAGTRRVDTEWEPAPVEGGARLTFEAWVRNSTADASTFAEVQYQADTGGWARLTGWEGDYSSSSGPLHFVFPSTGWVRVRSTATLPDTAVNVRLTYFDFNRPGWGTENASPMLAGLRLYTQINTTLIEDGAITTGKIAVGAITADSGIIGSLDAGTITVGEMEGARIKANTLTADKLLVGGSRNMIPNGDLEKGSAVGWPEAASYRGIHGPPSGGNVPNVTFPATSGTYSLSGWGSWAVTPGQKYVIEAWVRADKAGSNMYMTIMDQNNSRITGGAAVYEVIEGPPQKNTQGPFAEVPLTTSWVKVARKIHVPDGVFRISFQSLLLNHNSGDVVDAVPMLSGMKMYEPIGATLIEDGAVTTDKILANAITAGKIAALAIEADHLAANAVTADKIRAGAIDGKLITGATVRTAASGRRTIIDVEGLRSYDTSGNVTLTTSTSDGSIDMRGILSQTISGVTLRVGVGWQGNFPGVQWSDSNIYNFPPGVGLKLMDGSTSKKETLLQGPGVSAGNSYVSLQERGEGFDLRVWNGANTSTRDDWRVQASLTGNFMNIGSTRTNAPYVYMRRGTGDTGEARVMYNHPSNGGFASMVLRDRYVWIGSRDSNQNLVGSFGADADGTFVNSGTRRMDLRGKLLSIQTDELYIPTLPSSSGAPLGRSNGEVVTLSSARKYKLVEEPLETTMVDLEDRLLSVEPKTWVDRTSGDRIADYMTAVAQGEDPNRELERCGTLNRVPGMVAEDLEAAGLEMFVGYENGEPEWVLYDRIGPALIPIIRRLRDRVDALETKLGATA